MKVCLPRARTRGRRTRLRGRQGARRARRSVSAAESMRTSTTLAVRPWAVMIGALVVVLTSVLVSMPLA